MNAALPLVGAESAPGGTGQIRILVLDDHDLVRCALCRMINAEPDLRVCGAASVTRFDPAVVRSLRPDVVLLDVAANQRRAMELIRHIRQVRTGARVVAMALYRLPPELRDSAAVGQADFVIAANVAERVLNAVRQAGGRASGPGPQPAGNARAGSLRAEPAGAFDPLEREVMAMIGAGEATETIAVRMRLPLRAIHACIRKIKAKARISSAVALVRYCVAWRHRRRATNSRDLP